jgi:short-subunit dehydrogenase
MNGKRVVIPGLVNKVAAAISKRMPARVTAYFVRKLHKY